MRGITSVTRMRYFHLRQLAVAEVQTTVPKACVKDLNPLLGLSPQPSLKSSNAMHWSLTLNLR